MSDPVQLGRYSLFAKLASGGMATVYLGRLNGEVGFGRTVAIKRLHPHLATEPEFVSMFLDEARLAARVQHPNVVPTVDVVTTDRELFLVMDYVRGESLGALLRAVCASDKTIPVPIVTSCGIGLLSGLHAAHEAKDEQGVALSIVHRDVSPQNVFVGADGVTRVLDFGVAKAAMRLQTTREGQLKGKLAYMPPEQIRGEVSRRTDIYAAGVVLWEALACRRLYTADTEGELLQKVMEADVRPPSKYNADVPDEVDFILLKALAKDPENRYATAQDMAAELDAALRPASSMKVAEWVESIAGDRLAARNQLVAEIESGSSPNKGGPHVMRLLQGLPPLDAEGSGELPMVGASDSSLRIIRSDSQTSSTIGSLAREALPPAPAKRSWPLIAIALALPILAVAIFVLGAHSRSSPEAASPAAAPATVAPPVTSSAPSAAPAPSVAPVAAPAASSVAAEAHDAGVAAAPLPKAQPHAPRSPNPGSHAAPASSSHDISSLLDSR